jgi:hypothetical protein
MDLTKKWLRGNLRRASYTRKAPSEWARRQALLAATASDERHEYWALEFFEHRPFAKSSRRSTRCQLNFREGLEGALCP